MKNIIKRVSALLMAGMLAVTALPSGTILADEAKKPVMSGAQDNVDKDDIVILYTNDAHNAYEQAVNSKDSTKLDCIGYSSIAWFKKDIKKTTEHVALVDNGDAIQGDLIGVLSSGKYIVDIMNTVGYDVAIPGNHEFDFGMANFLDIVKNSAKYKYVSSNFMDLTTNKPALDAYTIKSYKVDDKQIDVAFIGVSTPETFTKSTPTYFQNEKGEYIYGFCEGDNGAKLYANVQASVDAAKKDGAEYVVVLAHLGTDDSSKPYTSKDVIANTTGIDVVLDGHSHSTIKEEKVKNKDGKEIILSSTGTKLAALGELVIDDSEGTISTSLVTNITDEDADTTAYIKTISDKFSGLKKEVVAKSEIKLYDKDATTEQRLVRSIETNLGDLCADAYKDLYKDKGVDCAFVNGGGIRAALNIGDITNGDIYSVHPFGNSACLAEVTGQQLLDALEMTARGTVTKDGKTTINEIGGFLQVSGITYDIDTTIASTVVLDDKSNFVKVEGERRVKNVKINGEPIDVAKTYKVASHNYALKSYGDGLTMFKGAKIIMDETATDNQLLRKYIVETLGGTIKADSIYANPLGEGRIHVITANEEETGCCKVITGIDKDGNAVISSAVSKVEAKAYTCEEDGCKEHYVCSVCGKLYKDAEATTELKAEDVVIKAHHKWKTTKMIKKPTTKKTGKRKVECTVCGKKDTIKCDKLKVQKLRFKTTLKKELTAAKLSKASVKFNIKITKNKTTVSYKVVGKDAAKYIKVTKKGRVTVKKGTPVGQYKIRVTAKETLKYAKNSKILTITVK